MGRKVRILSLDAGGIRGVLPGVILTDLEARLQHRTGTGARLADFFELIAGTSTGGILACGYLAPDAAGRPRYTAQEMLNLYLERGGEIFNVSLRQMLKSLDGWRDEKYAADGLEQALDRYFGDTTLKELLKPCLIAAYDIQRRQTRFFNQRDGADPRRNFLVRDVARATSAAPTVFETSMIRSLADEAFPLIDGAVFAANPAMCAYSEARTLDFREILNDPTLPRFPSARQMMIISIGTGETRQSYDFSKAKDWGKVSWAAPLLEMMMSGVAETIDYQLRQIFHTTPDPSDYVRIQPDIGNATDAMDDTSLANLEALVAAGQAYARDHETMMDALADRLVALGPLAES